MEQNTAQAAPKLAQARQPENKPNPPVALEVESNTIALLNRSEIDQQVATAHRFPRSVSAFREETLAMVTLTESVAQECIYALPRDGKTIEGPSARFAEIIASAWGNCRAGARVVSEVGDFVTAQGAFHDLQRNVAITYEVQRRIVDKNGRRYKADMVGVTANAACSIALRNAILKGIPKAFWSDMYNAARRTAMGDIKTLANRRAEAIKWFQGVGVSVEQVLETLEVKGVEDITLDHIVILSGIKTALVEGDTTPEQAFAPKKMAIPGAKQPAPTELPKETAASAPQEKTNDKPAASAAPGFEDAVTAVRNGDIELAHSIAATLDDGQKQQIEVAIANRAATKTAVDAGTENNGKGKKLFPE